MSNLQQEAPKVATGSAGKAWLHALELTAPIARNRNRVISTMIGELGEALGDTPDVYKRQSQFLPTMGSVGALFGGEGN